LKPANIMVTKEGSAKIIDLGLANLVEPLGADSSEAETAVATNRAGRGHGDVRLHVSRAGPLRRASTGEEDQSAVPPPAEPNDTEVTVECQGALDAEPLHDGKAGAVDDTKILIGPLSRNLVSPPKVLRADSH
jgi:serine/threonine protein kinase